MKIRRWKLALMAALLLGVLLALPPFWHYRFKRDVEAYRSELQAKGEKLSISELIPPLPSNGPNGAFALLNAASLLPQVPYQVEPRLMKYMGPARARVAWQQVVLGSQETNNIWPGLRAALSGKEDAFVQFRAALERPVLHFNPNYGQGYNYMFLPHLAPLKHVVQVLSAATTLNLHEGNFAEAGQELRAAVTLTKLYKGEPLMISQLVRIAITAIAWRMTWEALQFPGWSDPQLADLQQSWASIDLFDNAERSLAMERAMGRMAFADLRYSPSNYVAVKETMLSSSKFFDSLEDDKPSSTTREVLDFLSVRLGYWSWKWWWSYREELFSMHSRQAGIETMRSVNEGTAFLPARQQLADKLAVLTQTYAGAQPRFLVPDVYASAAQSFFTRLAAMEAQRELLVAAIALKRFQLRHGKFPSDSSALVPEFLPGLPCDRMDGQPLRYRMKEDGTFVLYSVGEDGKDDGGDATASPTAKSGDKMWKGRDWVWPTPASTEEIAADDAKMEAERNKSRRAPK